MNDALARLALLDEVRRGISSLAGDVAVARTEVDRVVEQRNAAKAVLTEILTEQYWVETNPGRPAMRMLNDVPTEAHQRWCAVLQALTA